jgi:hydroxymethylbilane synthase
MSTASSSMAPARVIRLGTRKSALATAQASTIAELLRAQGSPVELVGVTTHGDRSSAANTPIAESAGVGVFVAELRTQLLDGTVDIAVHSLKDLPTAPTALLRIGAVPLRADPRDALVARDQLTLATLPAGAAVGTGSPRRSAQLRAVRPDLDIRPLRGNVDTRLGKVADGSLDAVVVAAAGMARLGRLAEATELISTEVMVPAPGQGALAVECRAADADQGGWLHDLLASIDDASTRAAVVAERTVLAELEAGCTAPVGAYATVDAASDLHLVASVVSVDGVTAITGSASGPAIDAEDIGRRLAAELFAKGAGALIGRTDDDRTGRR